MLRNLTRRLSALSVIGLLACSDVPDEVPPGPAAGSGGGASGKAGGGTAGTAGSGTAGKAGDQASAGKAGGAGKAGEPAGAGKSAEDSEDAGAEDAGAQ